jgi:hypothetical protein
MTDQSPTRPVRANPAPRRALPRVKPLAAVPEDDERVLWASAHAEGAPAVAPAAQPATGRDLLIPNGPSAGAPAPDEKVGRKGRGSVPALSELMPPSSPRRKKGSHAQARHQTLAVPVEPAPAVHASGEHASGEHGSGEHGSEKAVKKADLVITLPKPLRKRLKAKAAGHGMTPEQAVAELISVWVDG